MVACTGSSQKEKPACVNTPVEPFTGLPVFDLQEQYPEKEIILQDIADVRYVVLETGDSSLVGIRPILMTDSFLVTVNKKSDVIFFDKSGKYLHSFNHTGMSGEEYGDIVSGYCIDEKAREIFIYDGLQSRIQVYGYGGAYRRTLKLPQNRMFASSSRKIEKRASRSFCVNFLRIRRSVSSRGVFKPMSIVFLPVQAASYGLVPAAQQPLPGICLHMRVVPLIQGAQGTDLV